MSLSELHHPYLARLAHLAHLAHLADSDRHQLNRVLGQLPIAAQRPLIGCLQAVAAFDPRPLPALIPLLGPTLRDLPAQDCTLLLERIARCAASFPTGVVPLFRSLGQVYDQVGAKRVLAWIATGEQIARHNTEAGIAFFALKSRTSLLTLRGASPVVYLSEVQGVLTKYLHMLSGTARGLIETEGVRFPPPFTEEEEGVVALPTRIEHFPTYEENFRLYRALVAHQAGRIEFGTYDCSPAHLWSTFPPFVQALTATPPDTLTAYFQLFPRPELIEALFLGIEGKRIGVQLATAYPGLRADLAWTESLTDLFSTVPLALLSSIKEDVWSELDTTGTTVESLQLATALYVRFLHTRSRQDLERASPPLAENLAEAGREPIAFLTGVNLAGSQDDGQLAAAARSGSQSNRTATHMLHYVYDEWDYEIEDYRPHWCQLREAPLVGDEGAFFSTTLTTYAAITPDIKREFQRLRPRMYRHVKGIEDGEEIDLDACIAARVDRYVGVSPSAKLYTARQPLERDVAVLFLLDVSASTAARLPVELPGEESAGRKGSMRIIEVLKEALVLLSTVLEEIGDVYAIYGFSSYGRYDVEVYPVKTFRESLSDDVKGRIGALAPQGSTRMGTAIRHAARRFKDISNRAKLLVLLSDGYPEDQGYGKPVVPPTYGLRDTMMALREAERSGILSFCLTVDKGGHDYLQEMCPPSRYMVIEDILSLPTELPKMYQRYIWSQWL